MYKMVGSAISAVILLILVLGQYWSMMPDTFDVEHLTKEQAQKINKTPVTGFATANTLVVVMETLLDKPGGYLSNDILPPGLILDDMPSFEFGALEMSRDLSLALRKDFSRSQSQSLENPYLKIAQPQFNIDHRSWA